eukprot:3750913-Alexandrium_andersonii.AAC.1
MPHSCSWPGPLQPRFSPAAVPMTASRVSLPAASPLLWARAVWRSCPPSSPRAAWRVQVALSLVASAVSASAQPVHAGVLPAPLSLEP